MDNGYGYLVMAVEQKHFTGGSTMVKQLLTAQHALMQFWQLSMCVTEDLVQSA